LGRYLTQFHSFLINHRPYRGWEYYSSNKVERESRYNPEQCLFARGYSSDTKQDGGNLSCNESQLEGFRQGLPHIYYILVAIASFKDKE
jgi:hypothetical protein